jgi:acid phosphatase type 7
MIKLLPFLFSPVVRTQTCSCDHLSHSPHQHLHSKNAKVFRKAESIGVEYLRPPSDSRVYKKARERQNLANLMESCESEQVHISLGDYFDEIVVSYVSNSFTSYVDYSTDKLALEGNNINLRGNSNDKIQVTGSYRSHSEQYFITSNLVDPSMGSPLEDKETVRLKQDTTDWAFDPVTGEHWWNWYNVTAMTTGFGQYNNFDMYYNSPVIHTVTLTDLKSDTTYYYRVADSCTIFSFKLPTYYYSPSKPPSTLYPWVLGLTGDVGQTDVSVESLAALAALEPNAVLLVGDLSYADGWGDSWDTFGRAFESLGSSVPVLTTGGNHEVQSGENWVPYLLRYFTPYQSSSSPDPAYWGREIGPVHVIALNSYAASSNTSIQYRWLQSYISTRVNRARTPWVIVMTHSPFYNSNKIHWMEGEIMRRDMEALLYLYGVDIVLSGHVHSYERTVGVYDNNLDICGPVHLVLGDGGNYEGEASPWREDNTSTGSPIWSAFREASFGVGGLQIVNSTHAFFSWHRHACGSTSDDTYHMNFSSSCVSPDDNSANAMETSDEVWIIRPSSDACTNRYVSSTYEPSARSSSSGGSNGSSGGKYSESLTNTMFVLVGVLGACCIVLSVVVVSLMRAASSHGEHSDYKVLPGGGDRS